MHDSLSKFERNDFEFGDKTQLKDIATKCEIVEVPLSRIICMGVMIKDNWEDCPTDPLKNWKLPAFPATHVARYG